VSGAIRAIKSRDRRSRRHCPDEIAHVDGALRAPYAECVWFALTDGNIRLATRVSTKNSLDILT